METGQSTTRRAGVPLSRGNRAPVTAEVPSRRLGAEAVPMTDKMVTLRDEFPLFRTRRDIRVRAAEPADLVVQLNDIERAPSPRPRSPDTS